jgi:hypothetical protein
MLSDASESVNSRTIYKPNQVPLTCSDASKYSDHIEYHLMTGDANMSQYHSKNFFSQKHNIYACDRAKFYPSLCTKRILTIVFPDH